MASRAILRNLIALLCAVALHAHAVQVTDDRGVAVDLPAPPQRIITLLPSLTETVCELGHCDRIVAVDDFSNWPERIPALPHVGGVEDANIERIVALRPDLVLIGATSRAAARLEGLGIKVFGLEPKSMNDVRRVLDKVAQLVGEPGAGARVWSRIDQGITQAARSVPPASQGVSVYFEVDPGPYAASEASHIGELLTRLGAANIVPARLGSVPKLNPEFVVRADPQIIIISDREAAALKQRPGWGGIRAVRDHRICALTREQGDIVVRPGPRLAEAARVLAQCLQPR
jgi:iron complex transport system substrate-binding protein